MKKSQFWRKKMWSLHNWIGLYAGVVIALLSISGVVALFKVELDKTINPSLYKVVPKSEKITLTPIIDSLKSVYGHDTFNGIKFSEKPDESVVVWFFVNKSSFEFINWEIFIDPYSGKIVGERDYFTTFAYFIRHLHVRLYEGLLGRKIVGIAGLALLISTITGFWIYGGFMKKQFFGAIRKKNLRIVSADYHKLIGIASLFFNLVIAITGAWLGLQGWLQPIVMESGRPNKYHAIEKPLSQENDTKYSFSFEDAYATSRQLFPEFIPQTLVSSKDGSRSVSIYGTVPRTAFERESFVITLDKETFEELHRFDIRKTSFGKKLFFIQESMHFGDWGGIWLKIIYAFFGITSGFLAMTGFLVYLKRTERKRKTDPNFTALKPLLIKWVLGILGVLILLAVLTQFYGMVLPSIIVITTFYSWLLFLIIREIIRSIKRKILYSKKAI
ncbi:PepSY domain-containing protein [Aquimarina sp. I32.4]|uniref:PepSY-associated TM helix domain-containing protein n=1 Tax=Aquimarina sp. I32.4 TaxID=2053903 RepID=UPI000CDE9AAA|nr:PepSY-associated TM helix domain-containing protein [Aquimarina sp. I32.4]